MTKMEREEIKFNYVNNGVCFYCKGISEIFGIGGQDINYTCAKNKNIEGKYKMILDGNKDTIDMFEGCEKFESTGLPAYPSILEELIKQNPLCKSIPSDSNATETFYEFPIKAMNYGEHKPISVKEVALP